MSAKARLDQAPRRVQFLIVFIFIVLGLLTPTAHASLLFVANDSDYSLKFFDASSGAYLDEDLLPGDFAYPIGVTLGPDGNIYVADMGMSAVDEYNGTTGAYIGQFIPSQDCGSGCPASALNQPTGLAFGPDGNLYVSNYGNDGSGFVNEYNGSTGAFISTFVGTSSGLEYPVGLTFDSDGNLYVANSSAGSIEEFNSSGVDIGPFVSPGNPLSPLTDPQSMVFGPDGNVYVADVGSGTIDVFTAAGGYLGDFTGGGDFGDPIDLAFGPDGHLYVSYGEGVAVFQGTFSSGGGDPELADFISYPDVNNPQFMAFGPETPPVPEPATAALFGLGVLGLGVGLRLRRSRKSPQ